MLTNNISVSGRIKWRVFIRQVRRLLLAANELPAQPLPLYLDVSIFR